VSPEVTCGRASATEGASAADARSAIAGTRRRSMRPFSHETRDRVSSERLAARAILTELARCALVLSGRARKHDLLSRRGRRPERGRAVRERLRGIHAAREVDEAALADLDGEVEVPALDVDPAERSSEDPDRR